jgi:hypothetical protein
MRRFSGSKPSATVDITGPLTPELARVARCYNGSDADATRALYADLMSNGGWPGHVAVNLLRAQKTSARAKLYRGGNGKGRYSAQAYETKNWSMEQLCKVLVAHGAELGIVWGWQADPEQEYHSMVLYVEMHGFGQASFHTKDRGEGPDYPNKWDGVRGQTAERILRFAAAVLAGTALVRENAA